MNGARWIGPSIARSSLSMAVVARGGAASNVQKLADELYAESNITVHICGEMAALAKITPLSVDAAAVVVDSGPDAEQWVRAQVAQLDLLAIGRVILLDTRPARRAADDLKKLRLRSLQVDLAENTARADVIRRIAPLVRQIYGTQTGIPDLNRCFL